LQRSQSGEFDKSNDQQKPAISDLFEGRALLARVVASSRLLSRNPREAYGHVRFRTSSLFRFHYTYRTPLEAFCDPKRQRREPADMMKYAAIAAMLLGSGASAQANLPASPNGVDVNHVQLVPAEELYVADHVATAGLTNVAVTYSPGLALAAPPASVAAAAAPAAVADDPPETPWASTLLLLGVSLVGLGTTRRVLG